MAGLLHYLFQDNSLHASTRSQNPVTHKVHAILILAKHHCIFIGLGLSVAFIV
jgi:hypothetical protein